MQQPIKQHKTGKESTEHDRDQNVRSGETQHRCWVPHDPRSGERSTNRQDKDAECMSQRRAKGKQGL